jgi:hypothetical protein
MKYTKILILICFLFIMGCTKISTDSVPPTEFTSCESDFDCIPQPGCHPRNCINSEFRNKFQSENVCNEMYSCGAAYNDNDCICNNNKCLNRKDIDGDPSCVDPLEN